MHNYFATLLHYAALTKERHRGLSAANASKNLQVFCMIIIEIYMHQHWFMDVKYCYRRFTYFPVRLVIPITCMTLRHIGEHLAYTTQSG